MKEEFAMRPFAIATALLASAALLTLNASPVSAQTEFGVLGGATVFTGELGEEFETGLHLKGFVETPSLGSLPFGLRGELGYLTTSHGDDSLRHISGELGAILPFATRSDAAPYLIGGIGLHNSKMETDHGDHAHGGEAENFLGVSAGVGIRWSIGGVKTLVETRFHYVFDEEHAQTFIPLSIGIRF